VASGRRLPWLAEAPPGTVLNLNVPDQPIGDVTLHEATLARFGQVQMTIAETGEGYVLLAIEEHDPGTDVALLAEGYATVTPLRTLSHATDVALPPNLVSHFGRPRSPLTSAVRMVPSTPVVMAFAAPLPTADVGDTTRLHDRTVPSKGAMPSRGPLVVETDNVIVDEHYARSVPPLDQRPCPRFLTHLTGR